MRLEIYDDTTPEPVTVVTLRLQRFCGDGPIWLSAVDERGKALPRGNILRFGPDGSMTRFRGLNPAFGFDLDAQGRLKID